MQPVRFKLTLLAAALVLAGCAGVRGPSDGDLAARVAPAPTIVPHTSIRHGAPSADAHYATGRALLARGDPDGASKSFDAALAIDADHVDALNGRAHVLVQAGLTPLAIDALERAIRVSPRSAHLHNNLGYLLLTQDRLADAARALRRALAAEPAHARALSNWDELRRRSPADAAWLASNDPVFAPSPVVADTDGGARLAEPAATRTAVVNVAPWPARGESPDAPTPPRRTDTMVLRTADAPPPQSGAVVSVSFGPAVEPPMATSAFARAAPALRPAPSTQPAAQPRAARQAGTQDTSQASSRAVSHAASPPSRTPPPRGAIEVSNGAGIDGLARRTASVLRARGVAVDRVTNYRDFAQPTTSIRHRPDQRHGALALQRTLGLPDSALVSDDTLPAGVQARLVIGHDLRDHAARPRVVHAAYLDPLREQAHALQALLDASFV